MKSVTALPAIESTLVATFDGLDKVPPGHFEPKLISMNYSGGKQSACLVWMILRDEIEVDLDKLIILNADPGMENELTYEYNSMIFDLVRSKGIYIETVAGPNLREDILALKGNGRTRLDNPPYWTKKPTGREGKLKQCCTQYYKIGPMDRAIRRILEERYGIPAVPGFSRMGHNIVEKWIGFTHDEFSRAKEPDQKYIYFRYPLYDLRMDKLDVLKYYYDRDLPIPPRSVCNACFANGLTTLKDMHDNRPEDWKQAVAVDNAVRNWTQIGVNFPVYVSKTLLSLEELAERGFELDDQEDQDGHSCDSGYCFL